VGATLTVVALLIAFFDGVTGINAPFASGHFASSAGIGVCADNMWRLHTVLPVLGYLASSPIGANYYMHHPLGVFWTVAALGKVFGFSNWVLRLPPLIYVTATPYFLSRIGRAVWGPLEGGLVALAFVALPITLGYANYHDLEQPVMFGCVVATWGYLRLAQTWRDRYAVASAAGFFFALNHDWQGYVWGAFFLAWLFVRGFVLPARVVGGVRPRTFGRYWALMAAAAVLAFALEILALDSSGQLGDLLSSGSGRTAGSSLPLSIVLAGRRFRIELMFTGLAIALGKIAAPVIVARAIVKRSELELLPLPLLLAAVVQYVLFKQGADIHIFWPHGFAAYFALAVGALAATVRDLTAWVRDRLPVGTAGEIFARRAAPWLGLVLIGLPTAFVLRDGLSVLRLARETGGRFAEGNLDLRVDVAQALGWFRKRVPPASAVAYHSSVPTSWALQWETRPAVTHEHQPVGSAIPPGVRTYIMDAHASTVADLRAASSRYHVTAVESFWLIDPKEPAGPITGYSFAEHEPSLLEGLSQGRVEPIREVVPDPFVTWEWRSMMGQPTTRPTAEPRTLEQIRIAHNAAVASGDQAAAARWRAALVARIDLPIHATFDNQTELLGVIRNRGAQRAFTFYFLAGVFQEDDKLTVHARVVSPPRFSTLPVDTVDLDLAANPAWPTTLWRRGGIYSYKVVFRKRPGKERLTAAWSGPVHRTDASTPIDVGRF
jgi:hypothetical protein